MVGHLVENLADWLGGKWADSKVDSKVGMLVGMRAG